MDYPSPYFVEVDNLVLSVRADGGVLFVNGGYSPLVLTDIDRRVILNTLTQFPINLNDNWDMNLSS